MNDSVVMILNSGVNGKFSVPNVPSCTVTVSNGQMSVSNQDAFDKICKELLSEHCNDINTLDFETKIALIRDVAADMVLEYKNGVPTVVKNIGRVMGFGG